MELYWLFQYMEIEVRKNGETCEWVFPLDFYDFMYASS